MADKNYAVTFLSDDGAVYLEIDGKRYEIAQVTASWAVNEIPQAQCLVAVGRDARSDNAGTLAAIHENASDLKQMRKARVLFTPRGEYTPNGDDWPAGQQVLFDGYYVGYAHRKMNGKVQVIVNLTHWSIDLTQSSCISKNSHPSNPASLTTSAVLQQVKESGGSQGAFVSYLTGHKVIQTKVLSDLWGSIKELFCELARIKTAAIGPSDFCGPGTFVQNDRALAALSRFEGSAPTCDKAYKHGVRLVPGSDFKQPLVDSAIGNAICNATVDSYANTTFWDKLIGEFCPMFQMAVVPLVDSALVIADTPTLKGVHWREIGPDDYDSFDQTAFVERPMKAVGVYGNVASFTGARNGEAPVNHRNVGGCYAADSVNPADGLVQYVRAPAWLDTLMTGAVYGATSTGNKKDQPTNTGTTTGKTPKATDPYGEKVSAIQKLYNKYAQSVYVLHTLRGRNGSLSGRLRFDIGPGSIVKVRANPDVLTEGIDKLAGDYYACVSRVTVNINCESAMAGTTFQLTHMRTAQENAQERTSVDSHPLFGRSIHGGGKHGAPLIDAYENLQ